MDESNIPIEEELDIRLDDDSAEWTEQISVAGGQLVETVQSLLREAVVRKITVVDKDGKSLIEIPLYAGVLGVALLGYWSVLALIAVWFTEVSVRIVREEMPEVADNVPAMTSETVAESLSVLTDRAGKSVSNVAERAGTGLSSLMARASEMAARAADSLEAQDNGNGHVADEPKATSPKAKATDSTAAEPARCQAITKAGTQCKRNALEGSDFCSTHQPA